MAEVGVCETTLACQSLAGGGSLLDSKRDSGWRPTEEEETGECPQQEDIDKVGGDQKPGQLGRAKYQQEEEWKQLGKKKHRRRPSKKKRRWKPYNKLTWEEKKMLEEKESLRASRIRAEMFAKGQPVAPYNTTQFLMDDHDQEEPDLCPPSRKLAFAPPPTNASLCTKGDSTDEDLEEEEDETGSDGMGGDGTEFLQRDFSETYERYHAESLQDMSKQELIKEYMELERCLSRMEEENNRLRSHELATAPVDGQQDSRIRELERELENLKEENRRLLQEREQVVVGSSGH
ncbi:protein HEXIM1 [Rhinophrynus dorsalis]